MVELIKYIPLNMEFRDIIYDTSYLLDCIIYLEECNEFFTFYNIDVYNNTDFSKMFSRCIYSYMEQQFMYPKEYLLKKFNSPDWKNELIIFTHLQKVAHTILELFDYNIDNNLKPIIIKNKFYKFNKKYNKNHKNNNIKYNSCIISGDRDSNGKRMYLSRQNAIRKASINSRRCIETTIPYENQEYIIIQPITNIITKPHYKWFGLKRNGFTSYCNAYIDLTKLFNEKESALLHYKILDLNSDIICKIFIKYGRF